LLKPFFSTTTDVQTHTRLKIKETIKKLGWTVLPRPPYIPNLPLSEFRLFGVLKDAIRGRSVENDELLEKCLRVQNSNW
jgi:transposase